MDAVREMEDADIAVLLEGAEFGGELLLFGEVEDGGGVGLVWLGLCVGEGGAVGHGALEVVPGLVDVGIDGDGLRLLRGGCGGEQENNEAVAKAHERYDVTPRE